jgi:glyoxylase-like metal-dependent hydrolase (beta-lactamase superfamily II)
MRKTVAGILLLLAANAGAQDFAKTLKSTEVLPGIYMIQGADGFAGGNMSVLVGEDHVAMIDDGVTPVAPILLTYVEKLAGRPINFMVNTHVHGDHAGGNAYFAENDVVVFAHDNIRKRLLEDAEPAGGPGGLPVITFAEGVNFHLNGIEARVFHVPSAHTDGDSVIQFPELNLILTGDIMFNGLFPFIDLDNGGSVDGYIAAQRKILGMADDETIIVPGHGDIAMRANLDKDLKVLIDGKARVAALVDAGKSEDDVVAANPLADYHDEYNWAFITTERMTRTLYRDLASGE